MNKKYAGFNTRVEADEFKDKISYTKLIGFGWDEKHKHFFEVQE